MKSSSSFGQVPQSRGSFKYVMTLFLVIARAFSNKKGKLEGNLQIFFPKKSILGKIKSRDKLRP